MNLVYRSSRDGLQLNNLKDKINNKSNLVFLFWTGNARIFGAFIKSKIKVIHDTYLKDENAFAFSLNNNKIYKILVPELALRFYDAYPFMAGNNGNRNGFYLDSGSIYDQELLNNPKVYDFQKVKELTEGDSVFKVLEIFEINFN